MTESPFQEELRIIDDNTYLKVQEFMKKHLQPLCEIPLNVNGRSLLVGNIFYAHYGNRLTLTTSGGQLKRNSDGELIRELRPGYQCHYKVRHPGECEGQSGYNVNKLDGIIYKLIEQ